jgi:pimeloyl-ACP methyl ester carboxylesterase
VFLHGLRGDATSWGAIPNYVSSSSLGQDFDIITPAYSATVLSQATIETSADQILTRLLTSHAEADPIFIIGYSLGDLIAREICRTMLLDGKQDKLLNKIPVVITLGTPLEGARIGNWLLRTIPFVSPKLKQLCNPKNAFDSYRSAIRASAGRKIRPPKQLHIEMEEDGVIAHSNQSHYTEDDVHVGVIPGNHRDFASDNEDASYVADVY